MPHVSEEIEPFLEVAQTASPQGYSLVVIDTIGRALQGVNENQQENASAFTAMVECIKRELNCSVLCLHHTGHENKDRERGSVVFGADADTRVLVERQEKAYRVDLHMVKQKDAPEWNDPVEIHLNEIRINGTKEASLVACTPEQRALTHTKEQPLQVNGSGHRSGKRGPRSKINLAVLERAIIEVLRSNRAREWSQKDLAKAVAMHETIDGVSSKTLAQHHMTDLREDSTSAANYLYDPAKKKWRWSQTTS